MLRRIGAFGLAAVLLLVSGNAFRQVPNEFGGSEPGSLLFGVLQVVIGTSAVAAALGLVRRARWASRAIGVSGIAAMGLLVVQPLYEPMPADAMRSIWLGAAVVGVAAAGMSWCARRLTRPSADAGLAAEPAQRRSSSPVPLTAGGQPADGLFAPVPPADPVPVAAVADPDATSIG